MFRSSLKKCRQPILCTLAILCCIEVTAPAASAFSWIRLPAKKAPKQHPVQLPGTGRVIVVDPGHGGIDGGTSGSGLIEKNLTLDISLRLRTLLLQSGFTVKMTRETDTDVSRLYPSQLATRHKRDLQNRLQLIRETQAVGVVSIHINSSVKAIDRGPIVFYAAHSDSGKVLATSVQVAVNEVAGSTQRPLPRSNLFVLRHAPCAAVLVEVGFVTNASDVVRLATPIYRQKMAAAIATATIRELKNAAIAQRMLQ